jgi:hypothetical protein
MAIRRRDFCIFITSSKRGVPLASALAERATPFDVMFEVTIGQDRKDTIEPVKAAR